MPELIAHGKIVRPTLAIAVASDELARQAGVDGALVMAVQPGSLADKAGLQPTRRTRTGDVQLGDVIVAVDEHVIHSANDLLDAFENYKANDRVTLTVIRDAKKTTVPVVLEFGDGENH